GSESKGDLVVHRAARIEDNIEHPGMPLAARYHDIVAIVSATRGTRECPFAWRNAFEPGLERQLPRRAIDPARRPDDLLRRACLGAAAAHRAHGFGDRQAPRSEIPDRTGALGLVRTIVGEQLALALRVKHVSDASRRRLRSNAEHPLERRDCTFPDR